MSCEIPMDQVALAAWRESTGSALCIILEAVVASVQARKSLVATRGNLLQVVTEHA